MQYESKAGNVESETVSSQHSARSSSRAIRGSQDPTRKDCCYYFFIQPLRHRYHDGPEVRPLLEIPIQTKTGTACLALLGKPNEVELMRIRIPNCLGEKLSENDCKLIQVAKEHALSVLRLSYDLETHFHALTTWTFVDVGAPPQLDLGTPHGLNPNWILDAANLKNTYINSFSVRDQLKLLTDGMNAYIPVQFRYLSLYKLLEYEFRKGNAWDPRLDSLLARHEHKYRKIGISQLPLRSFIHAFRDRCAHIRGRGRLQGITTLSNKDAKDLDAVLPLVRDICIDAINDAYSGLGFRLQHPPQDEDGLSRQ